MRDGTRDRILARLRAAVPAAAPPAPDDVAEAVPWTAGERMARLRRSMEAVRTEFLEANHTTWPLVVRSFLAEAGARTLVYGPGTDAAHVLHAAWAADRAVPPALVPYDRPVEECRATLFHDADAGFTTCCGGIADTGTLVLVPSPQEPRLLSLVPPIHVVLLEAARVWDTLPAAMEALGWHRAVPRHAVLVSGPSKTADIEQTLAYGVHGPKRLVVVVVT